MFRTEKLRLTE